MIDLAELPKRIARARELLGGRSYVMLAPHELGNTTDKTIAITKGYIDAIEALWEREHEAYLKMNYAEMHDPGKPRPTPFAPSRVLRDFVAQEVLDE